MQGTQGHRLNGLWRLSAAFATAMLWLTLLGASTGHALEVEFSGRAVKRSVLALYDSRHETAPHLTRIHKLAEMPLNYLGFTVSYRDVNQSLPDPAELGEHRALMTWFVEPLASPESYVAWLENATASDIKYVMLGEIAPREPDELLGAINRIMTRLGLRLTGGFVDLTFRSRVTQQDPEMIGFERQIDKVLPGFPVVAVRSELTRVHLTIETVTKSGPSVSTVVATNDRGGFVAQNYTVALEGNTDRVGWLINPFHFFKLALGDERFAIPDVTTLSGRRIYFSHIDGDGWNNLSEVEAYRRQQTLSSEVILREAILPYPDLPVSVGLIAGDVQPLLGGNPAGARVARQLFALPQVEVASHTHTHPYHWEFFEKYSRAQEEGLIKGYRPPEQPLRERVTAALMRTAGKAYFNSRYDPYVAGSDELPRTYLRHPFDLDLEVNGAIKLSEQLAPPGKRAKLYQWSGDTTPFEAAVRATREAGVRNINGGDTRLDREYPSIAYVPSIGRPVGRERQIYAVNSNENTYTNEWTGPFGGQTMLEHTLRNTDRPRRLKAFNLYYHMYSGEKQASLAAIKHFLELAHGSDVAPVAASDYAAIADDFFNTEIQQVDLFSWAVVKRGAMQTMRFDNAAGLTVNVQASLGVLGYTWHEQALYVALDSAIERAVIALAPRPSPTTTPPGGATPISLVQARWRFSDLKRRECGGTVTAQGFGDGEMVWRLAQNKPLQVVALRQGDVVAETKVVSDAEGIATIKLPAIGIEPLEIRLICDA